RTLGLSLIVPMLLALPIAAHSGTLYVANNGIDGASCSCGTKGAPCRSITCAIGNAVAGDTIIVGPGKYGDLDDSGTIGQAGEENGSPGCGCVLSLNKSVTLVSSDGAASTVIDAHAVTANTNVLIITTD